MSSRHLNEELLVSITEEDQVFQRLTFTADRKKLADFCIEHKRKHRGIWRRVIRVDSCHDEVHVHRFNARAEEMSRSRICDTVRVEEGFEKGSALVWDEGARVENIRRWKLGR